MTAINCRKRAIRFIGDTAGLRDDVDLAKKPERRGYKDDISTWEQCCSSFGWQSQSWFFPVTDISSEVGAKVGVNFKLN